MLTRASAYRYLSVNPCSSVPKTPLLHFCFNGVSTLPPVNPRNRSLKDVRYVDAESDIIVITLGSFRRSTRRIVT